MNVNENSIRALLIEDNPGDARLIEEILRQAKGRKFVLDNYNNLTDGLKALMKGNYDVLLLDLSLPDSRGFDTFLKTYARKPQIPIVILTGTDDEELAIKSVQVGAQDYLIKGQIDGSLLSRSISYAIERAGLLKTVQQELSERKVIEKILRKTNRALQMLSECNEIIVRTTEEQDVAEKICRAIVAIGKHLFAWIAFIEQEDGRSIRPVASAGLEQDQFPESASASFKQDRGSLLSKALASGKDVICNDIMIDEHYSHLRTEANRIGYRSFAVLPLAANLKNLGVLQIYSKEPDMFDHEEMKLLNELKEDIAYAIVAIRTEKERLHSEQQLRESNTLNKSLLRAIPSGINIVAEDGTLLFMNQWLRDAVGEDALGRNCWSVYNDDKTQCPECPLKKGIGLGNSGVVTTRGIFKGKTYQINFTGMLFNGKKSILEVFTDVTEYERAQAKIQEQYSTLKGIIESTESPIFSVDTNYCYTSYNRNHAAVMKTLYGVDIEISKSILEYQTVDEDRRTAKQNLNRALNGEHVIEEAYSGEDALSRRYFEVSYNPIRDENGTIIGAAAMARDLTERKQAEEALDKERSLILALMDNIPDSIYFKDIDSRFIRINKALAQRFGLSDPAQAVNKTDFDFFMPEHAQPAYNDEQEIIKSGQPIVGKEEKETWSDGGESWASTTKVPLRDQEGRITGTFGISRDITESKRAEKALEEQSLYFKQLFESSPAGTVMLDTKFSILNINQAFVDLFQFSLDEVKGKHIHTIIVPENKMEEAHDLLRQVVESGTVQMFETARKRKDGTLVEVLISGHPIILKNQNMGFYFMYVDISQQKRLQEQLIQAQKMESLGTLAGGIAHDFNNILAIIMGHSSLIEIIHSNPARLKESIDTIIKAAERGAAVVRQMLTFARKSEVEFKPTSVNDSLKEIKKLFHETFPKTMTLACHFSENLPSINADSTQLHQVLLNLFVNSRDAMEGNGTLTILTGLVSGESLRTHFVDARSDQYVSIEVNDTGIGMDETTLKHIFEPFFTTKDPEKGTGLGLSVVFGIMKSHEGFIDVQSEVGHGTTFFLYFPIKPLQHEKPGHKKEVPKEIPGGTETILVIEDEELLRELIRINLIQKGYEVLMASDGEEGIEKYKLNQHTIGLVLSDLGMPKLTGHEVLKKLKKINPSLKFVLASGFNDQIEKSEILKDGANMIVQKPYNTNDLLRTIRRVLDE